MKKIAIMPHEGKCLFEFNEQEMSVFETLVGALEGLTYPNFEDMPFGVEINIDKALQAVADFSSAKYMLNEFEAHLKYLQVKLLKVEKSDHES